MTSRLSNSVEKIKIDTLSWAPGCVQSANDVAPGAVPVEYVGVVAVGNGVQVCQGGSDVDIEVWVRLVVMNLAMFGVPLLEQSKAQRQ